MEDLEDFLENAGKVPMKKKDAMGYRNYANMKDYIANLEDWLAPLVEKELKQAPKDIPVRVKTRLAPHYYVADVKVGDVSYVVMVHD